MRYGQIRQYDISNGPGLRTTVFVTGCSHHCPNCFNKEYWSHDAGYSWSEETEEQIKTYLKNPLVAGLTILGGEPFENLWLTPFLKEIKEEFPDKTIWIYSGYTFEEILDCHKKKQMLLLCDVLVDGKYVDALRDPALQFRGSSNQRIINIYESIMQKQIVLYNS